MEPIKVKIINKSKHSLPAYETIQSAGMDLRANIEEPIVLQPGERRLIPTGIHIGLPQGYEAQVRPRSGLALKHDLMLTNSPGTVDAGYRGEIGVIMFNAGREPFPITRGDRIAQMVICRLPEVELVLSDELSSTERGAGGFGSTKIR